MSPLVHRDADPPQPCAAGDSGERSDVERVFREHNDALLRFIAARLGSKQEAPEIAQEAYVRLLRLDNREAVSYLRAFLFKIAANLVTDRLRGRARRSALLPAGEGEKAVFELSPEREIEGRQAIERMRQAIDELPRKCREAFLLYRIEELSVPEVAARLGLQERMVWRYVARALDHIRMRVRDAEGRP